MTEKEYCTSVGCLLMNILLFCITIVIPAPAKVSCLEYPHIQALQLKSFMVGYAPINVMPHCPHAIVGQRGDLTNLISIRPIYGTYSIIKSPCRKWGVTRDLTHCCSTIAVFKMSAEVIKFPTIGAASFGQSPYTACHLPVWG